MKKEVFESAHGMTFPWMFLVLLLLVSFSMVSQAESGAGDDDSVADLVRAAEADSDVAEVDDAIEVPVPAAHVLSQAPNITAMKTTMIHQTLVHDVQRVGEKLFLAGVRGHIGWSDDNGVTWQQAQVPTTMGITALHFATQDVGWAVGHDGNIFNTVDGGRTWALQLDGIAYNLKRAQERMLRYGGQLQDKQAAYDEAQALLEDTQAQLEEAETADQPSQKQIKTLKKKVAELEEQVLALDDEVYELDFQVRDAESVLTEENAPWPLMDVWFSDLQTGYAVGAFNAFLKTTDGGVTWENISPLLDNPDGFHLNAVAGLDDTIFVVGEAGLIFRSIDAGATWEALESPDDGSFYAIHLRRGPAELDADGMVVGEPALELIITGLEGYVYRSVDSGDSWEPIENNLRYNLNGIFVDPTSQLILMVGNDGAVVYSTDGGRTLQTHRLVTQVTLSSATVAADGQWILAGASGIQREAPEFKN